MRASTTTASSPMSAESPSSTGRVGPPAASRRSEMIQTGVERAESVAGDDVPVLISGGSLVGLSTALFLGGHGIPSLVVERHPGTAIHPRAALFNQRTIELYRSLGLEDDIVEASGARVRAERRDRVGRVARRPRDRLLLPQHQRGRRGAQPVAAAVHHPDRARADSAGRAEALGRPARATTPSSSRSRPTTTA